MIPCPPSSNPITTEYITPSQPEDQQSQGPPGVRKTFGYWNSPSGAGEPIYAASPSPATDIRTEDFVMLRRKHDVFQGDEELDIIEHRPTQDKDTAHQKPDKPNPWTKSKKLVNKLAEGTLMFKKGEGKQYKGKPNKWVRFLDVGISCPSDGSDDELAFCKPPKGSGTREKEPSGQ